MQPLETVEAVLRFFRENQAPIFFVNSGTYNLLNLGNVINGLRFINFTNAFDGCHAEVFVPVALPSEYPDRVEAVNNVLLGHPEVAELVRDRGGKALFLMFDEETERLAEALGLEVCFPPAALRHHLDSKLVTTRLANAAGVASVPHVLSRVESYRHLRDVARELGPDLVVQLPHGDSGHTTFFIASGADYGRHARAIAGAGEVKIMRRIRCRPLTIEGCVTSQATTLVGPLMAELTGIPALTPFGGGWCGNELVGNYLAPGLRLQARRATEAMGQQLARVGYRGSFGLDFLLDQDTDRLHLGEMNPRITGTTPLTSQAALDAGEVPLFLYHLMEWLGVESRVDVSRYNDLWVEPARAAGWGQLIIDHTDDTVEVMTDVPASGTYRLTADDAVELARREYLPGTVGHEAEALFIRTVDAGQSIRVGQGLGRLITRDRLLTDDGRLSTRATAWVSGFRALFTSRPHDFAMRPQERSRRTVRESHGLTVGPRRKGGNSCSQC